MSVIIGVQPDACQKITRLMTSLTSVYAVRKHKNIFAFSIIIMSSNGKIFCVTGHLFGEFTGHCLFRCRSKKTSKLRVTGLCAGNSPVTGEFPDHRWIPHTKASDAELMFSLICAWINGWVNNRFEMPLRPLCHHSNDFMQLYQDVTTYPCPKFNVGLANFWTLESLRGLLFRGPII